MMRVRPAQPTIALKKISCIHWKHYPISSIYGNRKGFLSQTKKLTSIHPLSPSLYCKFPQLSPYQAEMFYPSFWIF